MLAVSGLHAAARVVEAVALAHTTALLTSCGETTRLAVLVHGVGDPVDARVTADGLVLRVNTDDLEVLVHTILVHPVRVEHAEVSGLAADTLLGKHTERAVGLELVDTLTHGLTIGGTLGGVLLAVATAHTHTVDNVSLLGLVAETACLVRARGARSTVDHVELAELPATDTQEEAEDVALLFLVELLEVLVGTHLVSLGRRSVP